MHETLKKLTSHVRETKGSGEALRFYVNFIEPIKEYFGGDAEVKKLNLQNVIPRAEILEWLKNQKYETDYEETGEYKVYYEIDMPKILTDFNNWLNGT